MSSADTKAESGVEKTEQRSHEDRLTRFKENVPKVESMDFDRESK